MSNNRQELLRILTSDNPGSVLALLADVPSRVEGEVRPVFYRGAAVAEYDRDTGLLTLLAPDARDYATLEFQGQPVRHTLRASAARHEYTAEFEGGRTQLSVLSLDAPVTARVQFAGLIEYTVQWAHTDLLAATPQGVELTSSNGMATLRARRGIFGPGGKPRAGIWVSDLVVRVPMRTMDPKDLFVTLGTNNAWPVVALRPVLTIWNALLSSEVLDAGARVRIRGRVITVESRFAAFATALEGTGLAGMEPSRAVLSVTRTSNPRNRALALATRDPRVRELAQMLTRVRGAAFLSALESSLVDELQDILGRSEQSLRVDDVLERRGTALNAPAEAQE